MYLRNRYYYYYYNISIRVVQYEYHLLLLTPGIPESSEGMHTDDVVVLKYRIKYWSVTYGLYSLGWTMFTWPFFGRGGHCLLGLASELTRWRWYAATQFD